MPHRLQVGIDFGQKRADFSLLFPDGQSLGPHQPFANSCSGYSLVKIAGLWWPRFASGDFEAEDHRMVKTGNRY